MSYKYTLIAPSGEKTELGVLKEQMEFKNSTNQRTGKVTYGMYHYLDCQTIELIPRQYYPDEDIDNENIFYLGDEEARMVGEPERNTHMKVLRDEAGNPWDVVGLLIREEKIDD